MTLNVYKQLFTLVSIILFFSFNSCQKIRAKKYSGAYRCVVHSPYWEGTNPMDYYEKDSVYNTEIEVIRERKTLRIFNDPAIEISEIQEGKTLDNFSGCAACGISIKFENDSLFMRTSSGGNGGGSIQTYECKKE